jgi:hypothetical protein
VLDLLNDLALSFLSGILASFTMLLVKPINFDPNVSWHFQGYENNFLSNNLN